LSAHGRKEGMMQRAAEDTQRTEAAEKRVSFLPTQRSLSFSCPITGDIMLDPVIAADGHSYDRVAIMEQLQHSNLSPMTSVLLNPMILIPNFAVCDAICGVVQEPKTAQCNRNERALRRKWKATGAVEERIRAERIMVAELSMSVPTEEAVEKDRQMKAVADVFSMRGRKRPKLPTGGGGGRGGGIGAASSACCQSKKLRRFASVRQR
jgi:hypothetical protein